MRPELVLAISAAGGVFLAILAALFLWRPALDAWVDSFVRRLMKEKYPENIAEMYNVFAKEGVQNILEADLRGTTGRPLQRPFGTPRRLSHWEQLMLNPVYLTRKPLLEAVPVDTRVLLGPRAKRPLEIGIPVTISGMAYGFGLSLPAKIALAKAADRMETATNTGAGPFLPEERKHTRRLIVQYHRGSWAKEEEVLRQADMIEIQLGNGALGSAPILYEPPDLSGEFRDYMGLEPGRPLREEAMLPGVEDGEDLARLVQYLRGLTNGVPIGVKFGATHHLEEELAVLTRAGVDFITVDGAEAGINYGPAILADDTGLPVLPALCRSVSFLRERGLRDGISLIVSGGLSTPGQFLKALALGADAVAVGTIAVLAMAHTQVTKVIPWEPPTELVYENGRRQKELSIDESAKSVANYLQSCRAEMILGLRTLGRTSLKELSPADLCALTPEMADLAGVEPAFRAPSGKEAVLT